MGIRFGCHHCGHGLNVKQELAGRRGRCPRCGQWFRIPESDAPRSLALEESGERDSSGEMVEVATVARGGAARREAAVAPTDSSAAPLAEPLAGPREAPRSPGTAPPPPADPLEEEPDVQWYVRPPSGGQFGPADSQTLRQWIDQGRIAATALLWREGWAQWRTAEDALPGRLAPALPAPPGDPAPPASSPPAASPPSSERPIPLSIHDTNAPLPPAVRSRRQRRVMMIGALVALSIVLVVALVVVLMIGPGAG